MTGTVTCAPGPPSRDRSSWPSAVALGDDPGLEADGDGLDVDRLDGAGLGQLLVHAHLQRLGGQVDEHRVQVIVVAGQDDLGLVGLDQRHGRFLKLAPDQRPADEAHDREVTAGVGGEERALLLADRPAAVPVHDPVAVMSMTRHIVPSVMTSGAMLPRSRTAAAYASSSAVTGPMSRSHTCRASIRALRL